MTDSVVARGEMTEASAVRGEVTDQPAAPSAVSANWGELLVRWYQANAREYPWRSDPSPYHVWLSEIMLQQTRLETVRAYYLRFIGELPTVAALAAAPEEQVLKLWEGLGYYSRARNLHKAAKVIVSQYGGEIPADPAKIRALPGVGDYTAGAISAVAFGLPVPAVDGNVLRVVSRLFELEDDVLSPAARRNVTELVRAAYPPEASAFTQGLMELGETLCLPGVPLCDACPLRELCRSRSSGRAAELPLRKAKTAKRELTRELFLIKNADGRLLFCRRPDKGVLAGLWDLPEESEGAGIGGAGSAGDTSSSADRLRATSSSADRLRAAGFVLRRGELLGEADHVFTHLIWHMKVWQGSLERQGGAAEDDALADAAGDGAANAADAANLPLPEGFVWADPAELMLPTAVAKAVGLGYGNEKTRK